MMLVTRLGLPRLRGAGVFLVALAGDALGTGLYLPVSLLYFHVVAGLPLPTVGVALSVATLLTIPLGPLGGALADRFGARPWLSPPNSYRAPGSWRIWWSATCLRWSEPRCW